MRKYDIFIFAYVKDKFKNMKNKKYSDKEFLKTILEVIPNIVVVLDDKGYILYFNKFSEDLTGYSSGEVLGKNGFDIFLSKEMREKIKKDFSKFLKGNKTFISEYPIITKNGIEKMFKWNCKIINKKNFIMLSIGEDLTELNFARESEERYFKLMENLNTGILITNEEGNILYYNKIVPEILHYSKREFKNIKNVKELYFLPNEREVIIERVKKEDYLCNYEFWAKTRDGKPLEFLLNLFP